MCTSPPPIYAALVFPPNEQVAVDTINAVLNGHLGSDEMMAPVGKCGLSNAHMPDGPTTAEFCKR
ncbi:hypothetical protein [Mesorhizobium sp.]|uniref:hypothetical protein n=1 Tax=Mesorhizobium sp. TaxID=1871066 RepID=UPI000FE62340|nr:hypothetical protein [Mesorhizobium sp.]RWJ38943.1 MAG: hypothetical protein EOR31_31345 [Mesorhizobium sp.]